MKICLQKSASIQPRTDNPKIGIQNREMVVRTCSSYEVGYCKTRKTCFFGWELNHCQKTTLHFVWKNIWRFFLQSLCHSTVSWAFPVASTSSLSWSLGPHRNEKVQPEQPQFLCSKKVVANPRTVPHLPPTLPLLFRSKARTFLKTPGSYWAWYMRFHYLSELHLSFFFFWTRAWARRMPRFRSAGKEGSFFLFCDGDASTPRKHFTTDLAIPSCPNVLRLKTCCGSTWCGKHTDCVP